MDKISIFFTIYLLRPRHKRDRHHLYHRWQINHKVTDHDGQRVAFAIVIPTEQERKRKSGDKSINHVFAVRQSGNETMLKGIEERRNSEITKLQR